MIGTRTVPRYRIVKAGRIEFGGCTVDCLIRNLSVTGASLEVSSQTGIPQEFNLVVKDDGMNLRCRIVWRRVYRIGVAFD